MPSTQALTYKHDFPYNMLFPVPAAISRFSKALQSSSYDTHDPTDGFYSAFFNVFRIIRRIVTMYPNLL